MGITKRDIQKYIHALKDKHISVRSRAAYALGEIGADAGVAVPALIKILKDDEEARSWVAKSLGRIGKPAVPVLIEALNNEEKEVRQAAVYALKIIGPDAKAAVPALIESLDDEDKEVRNAVVKALNRIEGKDLVA